MDRVPSTSPPQMLTILLWERDDFGESRRSKIRSCRMSRRRRKSRSCRMSRRVDCINNFL